MKPDENIVNAIKQKVQLVHKVKSYYVHNYKINITESTVESKVYLSNGDEVNLKFLFKEIDELLSFDNKGQ